MRRILAATLAAVSCFVQAQSAAPTPTAAMVVNTLMPNAAPRAGFTRLRLSLTSNEVSGREVVRLAGIALCSTSVCYESAAPSSVTISNTGDGTSTVVAELEVPFSDIVSVRFKTVGGQGVLQGTIGLPETLKLERGFQGGDVLVVVQKRGRVGYEPAAAAANYIQSEGTSFYYNPKFATTVKLPHGVSVAIPAGAFGAPQVFIAGVHDTGEDYPLVDIYPAVKLAKPATVHMPVMARAAKPLLSNQSPATPSLNSAPPGGGLASQAQAARAATAATVEINATGVVRRGAQSPATKASTSSSAVDGLTTDRVSMAAATCNAAGWCNCADQVGFPANQQIIFNGMAPTGTVYLNWCTTIPPYVHITVSNLGDSRERFTIKHANKVVAPSLSYTPGLPLTRLAS